MRHFFRWSVLALLCLPAVVLAEFVGIPKADFDKHYRRQQDPFWCWASSAEMVLSYQGVKLTQDKIVERIKGMVVSGTGNPVEMVRSTNGIFQDVNGKNAVVSGQMVMGAPLPTVLYNQLKQKKPVVLTYQSNPQIGHAVVLTGMDATVSSAGVVITKLYVFDPFAYTVSPSFRGPVFTKDDSLIYREYPPQETPYGVSIPAGMITGVILMNGSPI
ncbi:MAG: C39 family peptidase [Polaromonas sp.]|nr:C39 family peptidase [Polaromonas sp.]